MKSVTEFPSHLLIRGVEARAALVAQGKTPEDIQASLGETFKFEGDRLKHFVNSLDIADQNKGLRRVVVVTLAEGENKPAKSAEVEGHHYVAEFLVLAQPQSPDRDGRGGRGRHGGRGGGGGGRGGAGGGGGRGMSWGNPPAAAKGGKKDGGKAPGAA